MHLFQIRTVFMRLIIILIIVMIPVYVIGIGIYNNGIIAVRHQILETMEKQVIFEINNLDTGILLARKMIYENTNDEVLINMAMSPGSIQGYNWVRSITWIQRRAYEVKNSSNYIKEVGVSIPSLGMTISTLGQIDPIDDSLYKALKRNCAINGSGLIYYDDRLFIVSEYPYIKIDDVKDPLFLTFVEFSKEAIYRGFNNISNGNDNIFIFRDNNHRFTLTNSPNNDFVNRAEAALKTEKENNSNHMVNLIINGKEYYYLSSQSKNFDMRIDLFIPANSMFKPLYSSRTWFWIFTSIFLLVIIIYSYSTYKYIHKPMHALIDAFRTLEKGDMSTEIKSLREDEFGYLYRQFNRSVSRLSELIKQVYEQKILMQGAILKQLQSQINPHFLYNIFFMLDNMVQDEDYKNLSTLFKQLGSYFKYITRSADEVVLLSRDVSHARMYADIQQRRFYNRIEVEFQDLPVCMENITVPRLILQPVIENAFEHGLKNKLECGLLKVWFEIRGDIAMIHVEDNGEDMDDDSLNKLKEKLSSEVYDGESTGIINIHRRLILKFKDKGGIEASRGEMGGLKITIKIPLEPD